MAQAHALFVLFAGIFVVPRVMPYLPDFDPLLAIMGLFGFLALMQHLGFAEVAGPAAARSDGDDDHPNGNGRKSADPEHKQNRSTEDLLEDAARCMEQNSYQRAEDLATKVADADPENIRAWELLATAKKWQGDRDGAAATVKKARELYECDSEGLRALEKELAGTVDPFATAREREAKGEEFLRKRQYDLACECYTEAIGALESSGDHAAAVIRGTILSLKRRRAECAQQLQDWSLCRRDSTDILDKDPDDAQSLLRRAAANEALEKFKAALDDARKLLAIDPKNTAANRIAHNCQNALRG
jgi:tetratricopeptide (TPR) repeat protein